LLVCHFSQRLEHIGQALEPLKPALNLIQLTITKFSPRVTAVKRLQTGSMQNNPALILAETGFVE